MKTRRKIPKPKAKADPSTPTVTVNPVRVVPRDGSTMGRRLLIDVYPDLADKIITMVREGVPLVLACATAQVSKSTLFNYISEGEAIAEQRDAAARDGQTIEVDQNGVMLLAFVDRIREARALALRRNVGFISLAARRDWKAAMALLEREYRVHFAPPDRIATVTTGEGETKTTIRLSWADGTPDDDPL